jgi:hypothetical protein
MKSNRLLSAFLVITLGALALHIVRGQSSTSPTDAPVLRCRALELVDDRGHVRAELKIFPAQPNLKMPDGTVGYPETVLLRLISSTGAPHVKITASEDGAGMVLGGEGGHVQILSRAATPFVKLAGKNGREQLIEP